MTRRFITYTKYHADETPYTVIEDTQPDPDNVLFQISKQNPVYRYPTNRARYLARKWNKQFNNNSELSDFSGTPKTHA